MSEGLLTDDELAAEPVEHWFARGIRGSDGLIDEILRAEGAVAAAVRLERGGVPLSAVAAAAEAISAGREPALPVQAELATIVAVGEHAADGAADRRALGAWLGNVHNLMVIRQFSR